MGKNGLQEATKQAERHMLDQKVEKLKAVMKAKLAKQQKKADQLCQLAKSKIVKLHGAKHAAARATHLAHALKMCHVAQAIMTKLRKSDAVVIAKVMKIRSRFGKGREH